jgi:hypothetical protein
MLRLWLFVLVAVWQLPTLCSETRQYFDYEMAVHDAIGCGYYAPMCQGRRLRDAPDLRLIDIALMILPDGSIAFYQVLRNTARDADLALVLAAINRAKIPSPPSEALKNGLFQMVIRVGPPYRPNQSIQLTPSRTAFTFHDD